MRDGVNRQIPVPLYYQISQLIRQQIENGELRPGDMIPTESELQARYQVSRATVRQAIAGLVYEGLLERRRAKGTIVSRTKPEATLYGFASFTNEILKRNLTPESRVLDFAVVPAPDRVAEYLELEPEGMVVALVRLRVVDGEPVARENWYAPAKYLPGIDRSYFKETGHEQSTYYMLQTRFGISLVRALDTISAVALERSDARLLKTDEGMPALLRTRISYTSSDVPTVYASGVYVIKLVLTLDSSSKNSA